MKRTKLQKAVIGLFFVLFVLYALSLIFPFLWTLYNSFKTNREFFAEGGVWSLPQQWMVSNYAKVWNEYNMVTYFWNSIKLTAIGTAISVLSAAMASYIVAKYDFKLKRVIYITAISVMLIPAIGSISALYKFMNETGLYNTHFGIILLYSSGLGLNFIVLYGFFLGVSWSYAEAAFVDGASDWQVFAKVMIPQAMPALGAVSIITGIGLWNDYFTPWMFLADKDKFTLALGLRQIVLEQAYAADWPKMFAAMIVATVPILIVYSLFQKTLIENTVAGGLKG
ncbi:carbohydrate ABC transporter permease [Paenibacillus agaridevorans]|jgi:ABC-type glycerol-3-phosphate transport system permease component|uniref:carbohydrate ABC transporter permease n=1 Tax=Paenibacillus agaridevorans TaxID=171404 RepID=UPI001BE4AABD|nr:carbohydrate ABC transporter permease [Paenibacillus agaridevorans]